MALGPKFRLDYSSQQGEEIDWRLTILEEGYSGEILPIRGTSEPIEINWVSDDDVYTSVIGSNARINLKVDETTQYDRFQDAEERQYQAQLEWSSANSVDLDQNIGILGDACYTPLRDYTCTDAGINAMIDRDGTITFTSNMGITPMTTAMFGGVTEDTLRMFDACFTVPSGFLNSGMEHCCPLTVLQRAVDPFMISVDVVYSPGGELTATLNLTITDPVTGRTHTINWFNENDMSTSLGTGTSIMVTEDGDYTVVVTASDGLQETLTVSVDVNEPVMVTLTGPSTALPTQTITLSLSATDADGIGHINSYVVTRNGVEIYNDSVPPTGNMLTATGYATYVFTATDRRGHSASATHVVANASDRGESDFGAEFLDRTIPSTSSMMEINTSAWEPAWDPINNPAHQTNFQQTQTFNIRTTFTDEIDVFEHTCNIIVRAATGDATQADCTGGVPFGSDAETRRVRRSRAPETSAQMSRTRTIVVTATTETREEGAPDNIGDQNADMDTLDTAMRTIWTADQGLGTVTGEWNVITNRTPRTTLNFTGPANQLRSGGNENNDFVEGNVGTAWSFTVRFTPNNGFEWATDGTGANAGSSAGDTDERSYSISGTQVNALNTIVTLDGFDAVRQAPVPFQIAYFGLPGFTPLPSANPVVAGNADTFTNGSLNPSNFRANALTLAAFLQDLQGNIVRGWAANAFTDNTQVHFLGVIDGVNYNVTGTFDTTTQPLTGRVTITNVAQIA